MSQDKASVTEFIARFESLKKQYFRPQKPQRDADGDEIISAFPDRSAIVKMFEFMNVEIPMHPGEPPVPVGTRTEDMVGEWWKKPRSQRQG